MSITVQCPNAGCGQIHKVKNKYAGLRCRCPACGGAMHVPGKGIPVSAAAVAPPAPVHVSAPPAPAVEHEPSDFSLFQNIPEEAPAPATPTLQGQAPMIDFSLPEKPRAPKSEDDEVGDLLAAAMEEAHAEEAHTEDAANGVVVEEEEVIVAEEGVVIDDDEVKLGEEEPAEAVEAVEEPAAVADDDLFAAAAAEEVAAAEAAAVDEDDLFAAAAAEEVAAAEAAPEEAVVATEDEVVVAEEEGIVVEDEVVIAEDEVVVAEDEVVVAEDDLADLGAPPKGKKPPAKGKGKPAPVEEEEDIFAEDDLEDLAAPPKKKGKGKPAPVEEEEAIVAEDDLEDLAAPPKKRGKGKASLVDEDEAIIAEDDLEDLAAPPKKKGKGKAALDEDDEDEDNVRPLRGRRRDEDDEGDEEEDEEDEGKKKGKFAKSTAIALLVGVISLLAVSTSPFLGGSKITATGNIAATFPKQELGIKEDKKIIVLAVPLVGAIIAGIGLFLAWRSQEFGVLSLSTSYLAWLIAWALLFLSLGVYQSQLDNLDQLKKTLSLAGRGGELALSIGTFLWVSWIGAALAIAAFTLGIMDMHKRTWAKVVFLVLFLLLAGIVVLIWTKGRKDEGKTAARYDPVPLVHRATL